jgi:allophycocyanin-B
MKSYKTIGRKTVSIVAQTIAQSDEANRFFSSAEITKLRLKIAQILMENEQKIVQEGSQRFWAQRPNTPSNSGNPKKTALCQRDQAWYLRLISYCVLAGNVKPLEDIGIDGMREMYVSLGIPLANLNTAMRCLKEVASGLMSSEEAAIASPYFDYLIRSMA